VGIPEDQHSFRTKVKTGNIIHHEAKGVTSMDAETAKPMSEDTTFWIASCTKLLTTIAAMQCVERGQLDLDADAIKILPELNALQILTGWDESTGEAKYKPRTKSITLRQLLTHSAGMGYDFLSPDLAKLRTAQGQGLRPPTGDIVSLVLHRAPRS
jgi:CubicO group peptidase (beta-lactamase class C family)